MAYIGLRGRRDERGGGDDRLRTKAAPLLTDSERASVIEMLARNPECGAVIPGTGGVRKVRIALEGRGKSGGARVVY